MCWVYCLSRLLGWQPLLLERACTAEKLDLGHGMTRHDRECIPAWYRLNLGDGMYRRRGVHCLVADGLRRHNPEAKAELDSLPEES